MELLSKITMKSMLCQPKQGTRQDGVDAKGKPNFVPCAVVGESPILDAVLPLARIFGRATSCKAKTSDFGESFQFNGSFEAIRLSDGETFRSSKLFLPKILEGLLAESLLQSEDALDFVVEIGVKASANAHHYEWTVKPLMDTNTADNLAHLRGAVKQGLPAIAHEKEPEPKAPTKPDHPKTANGKK